MKLVVIDPIFTYAASKADLWIPIRPGADMPLYMAIMYQVVHKGAEDREYLLANTCAPFLVRSDTGAFLRRSDTGVEPDVLVDEATGAETTHDPYMVLEGGALVALDEAGTPDLQGEVDVDGVACRTAYDLLLDEIEKFSPEVASELTEIPVETIEELADICMDTPVFHYIGYGAQARTNGHHVHHAGYTMAALTGNLGKPGANYGNCWNMYFFFDAMFGMPAGETNTTPGIAINDLPAVVENGTFQGQDFPIKVLYVNFGNPLNTSMDTNHLLEAFSKLDYVAVADSAMTDTARYADLILPVCQWFEYTDVTFAGQTRTLSYNEKAIEPLYESKTDADIVRGIAGALGLGEHFTQTDEEILYQLIDTDLGAMFGISYDRIKAEGDVRFVPDSPHVAYAGGAAGGAFSTPSGRLEFYLENPTPSRAYEAEITPELVERERLPHWFPPAEAWLGSEAAQKYPLFLMSERPRYRVHGQWSHVPALRELDPEPFVKINPLDAADRGIEDGTYVECYNDHGSCVALAILSEAIRPGTLVYPKGWQMDQFKAGSWTQLISNQYDPFIANANFMDVACEVRPWEGAEGEVVGETAADSGTDAASE